MANNIAVKDQAGATQTVKTTDNAGVHTPHHNIDSLPALPAGTNNIGDVDVLSLPALPAGTNNIGDVDVLTMPATAVEDVAASDGATGIFVLGVRNDAAATRTSTDGDYGAIALDAAGRVGIADLGGTISIDDNSSSITVDNGGTFATQESQLVADDAAFTVGTTKVYSAGFLADETATDSVDEGDVGAARMTLDRKQHVVAALESAEMRVAGVSVVPKFAAIAAASSGDNTLVAAVTSKKIRVLAMTVVAASAVNLYLTSAAGGTVIFGGSTNKINLAANGGFVLPYNPLGWFENSSVTQALVLNLSAAVAVSGGLVYIEV